MWPQSPCDKNKNQLKINLYQEVKLEETREVSQICPSIIMLSRASEVGSPTNSPWAPGSDKTRGQGSFGPFTGGLPIKLLKRNEPYI